MKLPRNAQIWAPAYVKDRLKFLLSTRYAQPKRVWLSITDHFEPLWHTADRSIGERRVSLWRSSWPRIAAESPTDSAARPPQYTFFFPQEEYDDSFLEPLAEMVHNGIADVEVHIHHDREGRQNFIDRISDFCHTLNSRYRLLHASGDKIRFGFIHGNWALDNSLGNDRWCGLNDEIQILRDLGCYADFTMPSGDSETQSRMLNKIYWCVDDPQRPKSYDTGVPVVAGKPGSGDLLMIPGPFGLRWGERMLPRMETGELAHNDPPTKHRVKRWFDLAPRIGSDLFIKLYTHGSQERNSDLLLGSGALKKTFELAMAEAVKRQCGLYFVTAWQMYRAIDAVERGTDPVSAVLGASVLC
jgi:hypothetical protein